MRDPRRDNRYLVEQPEPTARIMEIVRVHPNVVCLYLTDNEAFADAPFYRDTLVWKDPGHISL